MKKLYFLFIALSLISCGRFGNKDPKKNQAKRIISASKQYTEIIYALEADNHLVAVDMSSTYPEEAQKLPTIGYHMKLSFEGIMSAKPDVILHHGGKYSIGPEHVVRQLNQLDIPLKTFENKGKDIPSTKALILEMGEYFGKQERAQELCETLDLELEDALKTSAAHEDSVKVIVMHYGRATNMYLAVGKQSVAGKMIEWAGGVIPINKKGMERITSPEIIAKANPDVILLTGFGYDRLGSPEKVLDLPGVSLTKAAKNNRIYRVDAHDLIYFGPRTGENVRRLSDLIHQ